MIRLSDIALMRELPAFDAEGRPLGTVDKIFVSDVGKEPRWVTLASTEARPLLAPLVGAEVSTDGLRLAVTQEQLLGGPEVAADEHLGPDEEAELARYYGFELSDPVPLQAGDPVPRPAEVGALQREEVGSLTLSAERAVIRTEPVSRQVRVRRHVVTETQLVEVPLRRERMIIEKVPLEGGEPELIDEFTVREERVTLVQKDTFLVNDVQLGTELVTETERVTVELAREQLEVTWEDNAGPV